MEAILDDSARLPNFNSSGEGHQGGRERGKTNKLKDFSNRCTVLRNSASASDKSKEQPGHKDGRAKFRGE